MQRPPAFRSIDDLPIDPAVSRVYEHGWQSWSPSGLYPVDIAASPRPARARWATMAFRPERPAPPIGFQGEGLLAVVDPTGESHVYHDPDPRDSVASIRATRTGGRLVIAADGPIERIDAPDLAAGLASVADRIAAVCPVPVLRPLGPGWCSWYGYGPEITDAVLADNLAAMDGLGVDIPLVQIDDGYQAAIGDWLVPSGRITSLADAAARIRASGREAGIWTAPFLVGAGSLIAREHPDWLVGDALAADEHWGQPMRVLDVTHPDAADHLASVYRTLAGWGYRFHKIDFVYGGAMHGRRHGDASPIAAYREGLRIIRAAIGPDGTILGCGAPLLPSIGLVDAMRVSPDIDRATDPLDGDLSQPAVRSALAAGRARAWTHGRWWVADPDCLLTDPAMPDREAWIDHLTAFGGLTISGDRLTELDEVGLDAHRTVLRPASLTPPGWLPDAGPDGGRLVAAPVGAV